MATLLLPAAIAGLLLASAASGILFMTVGILDQRDPRSFNFAMGAIGALVLALLLAGYAGSVIGGIA